MNIGYNERNAIAMGFNENNAEGLRALLNYCNTEQKLRVLALFDKNGDSLGGKELSDYNEEKWNLLSEFGVAREGSDWAIAIPVAETSPDRDLRVGDIVVHFKYSLNPMKSPTKYMYEIVAFAKHSETGEPLVVYRSVLDHSKVCARPKDMFLSETDTNKYPEATQKYRFEKLMNVGDIVDFENIGVVDSVRVTEARDALFDMINELNAEGKGETADVLLNVLEVVNAIYT